MYCSCYSNTRVLHHACSSLSSKLMYEPALSATTSRTSRHHRCRTDVRHARSWAPIVLTIAYSRASLHPGVLFFFFFWRDTVTLCISICSSRWFQNCILLHGYDHVHLDLDYLDFKGISSACGTHWFLLQSQHSRYYDAATAGVSVRRILHLTYSPVSPSVVLPLWLRRDVRVYLIDYIFCIIDYHICQDIFGRIDIMYCMLSYVFRSVLPLKILVLYIYRSRGTIKCNQQLYVIYSSNKK
jgi:hypothetical protein